MPRTQTKLQKSTKTETPPPTAPEGASAKLAQLARPIKVEKHDDLLMFVCPTPECKNIHFRHAGYIELQVPHLTADRKEKLATDSIAVRVCTKCKSCFIWFGMKCYDVTKLIDLEAWDKTEREMQHATGPGGQC